MFGPIYHPFLPMIIARLPHVHPLYQVGRTSVQYGTRHPDWTSNEEQGGKAVGGGGDSGGGLANRTGFTLPFFVPESEKWGCEAWPPMSLEV